MQEDDDNTAALRKRQASMVFSQKIREQRKRISKVFEYFTGDEFEEFDRDFTNEELAKLSDSELMQKEVKEAITKKKS